MCFALAENTVRPHHKDEPLNAVLGNNTGQQISKKKNFASVMIMLLIYLFASMKLEKGHKKITWF